MNDCRSVSCLLFLNVFSLSRGTQMAIYEVSSVELCINLSW